MSTAARSAPTRQRIIEAVLHIIGRDGVAAVTNRRIAKEAGVSLGSVTYHFATQHELLRESLLHFVRDETRRFTELADECRSDGIDIAGAAALAGQVAGGTGWVFGQHGTPACGSSRSACRAGLCWSTTTATAAPASPWPGVAHRRRQRSSGRPCPGHPGRRAARRGPVGTIRYGAG
jgi:AcrR family transcriptional regulator